MVLHNTTKKKFNLPLFKYKNILVTEKLHFLKNYPYVAHWRTKFYNIYLAIFVCMTVCTIHVEVVSDQSTPTFVEAFQRFVAY